MGPFIDRSSNTPRVQGELEPKSFVSAGNQKERRLANKEIAEERKQKGSEIIGSAHVKVSLSLFLCALRPGFNIFSSPHFPICHCESERAVGKEHSRSSRAAGMATVPVQGEKKEART
ncbi:hypothetical protein NL676_005745 [Syzygium grande]|nr:hypothetical protein NL676_005745 [Syzygium grande]